MRGRVTEQGRPGYVDEETVSFVLLWCGVRWGGAGWGGVGLGWRGVARYGMV